VLVVSQIAQGGQQRLRVLATRDAVREMGPILRESALERFTPVHGVAILIDHVETGVAARIPPGVSEQCAKRG
jgi:hypothetical protein